MRMDKERVEKILEETRRRVQELEPLQDKLKEMTEKDEKSQSLIRALKQDGYGWKVKATQLAELNKKLSPEELKKHEAENVRLNRQVLQLTATAKQQTTQVHKLHNNWGHPAILILV